MINAQNVLGPELERAVVLVIIIYLAPAQNARQGAKMI